MPSVVLHQEAQLSLSGRVHCLDVDLDEHGLVDLLAAYCFECHADFDRHADFDLRLFPLFGVHPKHFCYRCSDGL